MNPVAPVGGSSAPPATAQQPAILTLRSPTGAIARLPVGARIEAQVLPNPAGRGVHLQTPRGILTLAAANPPPAGTGLTLELRSTGDTMRFAVLATHHQGKDSGSGFLAVTQSKGPVSAQTGMHPAGPVGPLSSNPVPAAGGDGPGPLAALLGLRAGIRAWIGGERATRMEGLEGPLAGNRDQPGRSEADGWRLLPLPLVAQGESRMARLWVNPASPDNPGGAFQFALEMDFPATGPLRFAGGLLDSRFDLVLAVETALPESLSRNLPEIFARASREVGLAGRFSMTIATSPKEGPDHGSGDGILV